MSKLESPKNLDTAKEISQETRFRAINIVSGGEKSLKDIPQEEVLAVLQEIAGAKDLQLNFTQKSEDKDEKIDVNVVKIQKEEKKRVLTPEEAEKTLKILEERFKEDKYQLHEGSSWDDVRASLEANPEALWSIAQMEAAGHEPDVYHEDMTDYYIGTCSKEPPESTIGFLYDKKAADKGKKQLRQYWRGAPRCKTCSYFYCPADAEFDKLNNSAVEMANAMGIKLMTFEHYKYYLQMEYYRSGDQGFRCFDEEYRIWLLTEPKIRSEGDANISGCGDAYYVRSRKMEAHLPVYYRFGWRGSIKVKKVTA